MIDYELVRTNRKTVCITVSNDARVVVKAPIHTKKRFIDTFVLKNEEKIIELIKINKKRTESRNLFLLNFNSKVLFLGKEYLIIAKEGNKCGFDGEAFYMPSDFSSEQIKEAMIKLYKKIAAKVLKQKVYECSEKMSLLPSSVKITSATTRWGSCSGKNGLCFSWRLIMASDEAIESVVVHELAHIKEHNHSKRFWNIVYNEMPNYKKHNIELKALSSRLRNENWD